MSNDIEIFIKNEQKADALQEKYGLNMTFRDLYACETITESEAITIPDGVTEIGECAFLSCTGLESISIPDSVTKIGERAFKFCGKLVITTPAGSYAAEFAKKKRIKLNLI